MPKHKNAELDRHKTKKKTIAEEPSSFCVFKIKLTKTSKFSRHDEDQYYESCIGETSEEWGNETYPLKKDVEVFAYSTLLKANEAAQKMCREYSTQEVTVNDETDEEAEYEIIDSNPIKSKNKWTIEYEEEEDRGFFILTYIF